MCRSHMAGPCICSSHDARDGLLDGHTSHHGDELGWMNLVDWETWDQGDQLDWWR